MGDDAAEFSAADLVPDTTRRLDGVVIGVFTGNAGDGAPLVAFPGNPVEEAVAARSTIVLQSSDIGCEVALMFEQGDPTRPLIMGRILRPEAQDGLRMSRRVQVMADNERVEIKADREIVLRCGRASITLTRAGKILLRGTYLSSRSSGVNKIKGGSVQLN